MRLKNKKQRMMELARRTSLKSNSRFRVGCVVAKGSRVISFGFNNMLKTHPSSKSYGNYLHAEVHALLGLPDDILHKATAYVARSRRNAGLAYSRPCAACKQALRQAGVRGVYYSTDDQDGGYGYVDLQN